MHTSANLEGDQRHGRIENTRGEAVTWNCRTARRGFVNWSPRRCLPRNPVEDSAPEAPYSLIEGSDPNIPAANDLGPTSLRADRTCREEGDLFLIFDDR